MHMLMEMNQKTAKKANMSQEKTKKRPQQYL
jgi:hypothetical protein